MIRLEKVNSENLWKLIKLTVREDQRSFVASNTASLLEAYLATVEREVALPFGIFCDDEPVGFVMFGYGSGEQDGNPSISFRNYCIWRFMIDAKFQGRGYGRQALQASLDYLRTWPCGKAEYCWLSYEKENARAKALYESFGFRETGEVCDNEIVSAMKL